MTNENKKDDNGALVPIVLGIGIGAAVLLGNKGQGGGGGSPNLILSGESHCDGTTPRVFLTWTTNTAETAYDLEIDGHIVDTVYHQPVGSGLWHSAITIAPGTHSYKLVGVNIAIMSNTLQVDTSVCDIGVQQTVTDAVAVFS